MNTQSFAATGLAILLVGQTGCGVDSEALESLQSAVRVASSPQPESPTSNAQKVQSSPALEAQFVPSNPQRQDPFSFPDVANAAEQDNQALSTVSEVEILGFANVGTQHVLIRSGDKTKSLKVGQVIDGVRIVAINPPTVQLQMGTLLWTATMFDKQSND